MTPLQRRNLRVYLQYRERSMTVLGLFRANLPIYFYLLFFFGFVGALFYCAGGWRVTSYLAVALVTMLARDIGYFRRATRIWPVLRQVLDWQKVEQLASSEESVK
ncbi:MAG: hypothetical protein ABJF10_07495 [Chthoniobacter sp.]|uniref:hypothetical protein n=1 Tax=Chthoniobacter sp. TaxID=2510640 RepID=UPI0032A280F5